MVRSEWQADAAITFTLPRTSTDLLIDAQARLAAARDVAALNPRSAFSVQRVTEAQARLEAISAQAVL